jgi:hypothetical protein
MLNPGEFFLEYNAVKSKIYLLPASYCFLGWLILRTWRFRQHIVTYPGFAWLITWVLGLIIEFIGSLYNWLHQFTNLTHFHLLPTGHSMGTILTSHWTEVHYSVVLPRTPSILLTVPSCNSSAWTPGKTQSCVVKNTSLLVRYLAMNVLLLLRG